MKPVKHHIVQVHSVFPFLFNDIFHKGKMYLTIHFTIDLTTQCKGVEKREEKVISKRKWEQYKKQGYLLA